MVILCLRLGFAQSQDKALRKHSKVGSIHTMIPLLAEPFWRRKRKSIGPMTKFRGICGQGADQLLTEDRLRQKEGGKASSCQEFGRFRADGRTVDS